MYGNDDNLDKTNLMRLAGRFSRRLQSYAEAHQIPFIRSSSDERKHLVAQQYLPQDPQFIGLFLVLVSRASGLVWDVSHTPDGRIGHLSNHYSFINHFFFHIMDPDWGHVVVRMSSHPPLPLKSFSMVMNLYPVRPFSKAGILLKKETVLPL